MTEEKIEKKDIIDDTDMSVVAPPAALIAAPAAPPAAEVKPETVYQLATRLGISPDLARLYHNVLPLFENTSVTLKKYHAHFFQIFFRDNITLNCIDNGRGSYNVDASRGGKSLDRRADRFAQLDIKGAVERIEALAKRFM